MYRFTPSQNWLCKDPLSVQNLMLMGQPVCQNIQITQNVSGEQEDAVLISPRQQCHDDYGPVGHLPLEVLESEADSQEFQDVGV